MRSGTFARRFIIATEKGGGRDRVWAAGTSLSTLLLPSRAKKRGEGRRDRTTVTDFWSSPPAPAKRHITTSTNRSLRGEKRKETKKMPASISWMFSSTFSEDFSYVLTRWKKGEGKKTLNPIQLNRFCWLCIHRSQNDVKRKKGGGKKGVC